MGSSADTAGSLAVRVRDGGSGVASLGVFDGVKAANPSHLMPGDVLLYTDLASGERRKQRSDRMATWAEVDALFAPDAR